MWRGFSKLVAPDKLPGIRSSNMMELLVFAGKDASRALGKTSTKPEDVRPDWKDLDDKEKGVLNDWVTFFSKRYNVVGRVVGATNTE